jgi:CDP-glycerol glycerophosphotransferase
VFDTYSRVAFANADRMQRYLDGRIVTRAQAVLVGYPKLDALVNGAFNPTRVRRSLGLDPARPTALFSPTWSSASALHVAGEAIIEHLIAAGINVIAKLHDRSLQTSERFTDGIDWRARLARFAPTGAFALATTADSSPYLAAADLMVTDHSSIGFEYLTLDRPLIVFDAPDLARVARINPEKIALLRSAATVVGGPDALVAAAQAALKDRGRESAARRRVAEEMFYRPGTATNRALHECYALLDLELVPSLTARGVNESDAPGDRVQAAV